MTTWKVIEATLPAAAFSNLPETNDPEALFFLHGFAPIPEGLPPPPSDPEELRQRWLPHVKNWFGEEKYYELEGCHKHGGTYLCPAGGERHRFGRPCNLTTCPIHGPRKLRRQWMRRLKNLRGPLVLAEWRPAAPYEGDLDDFAGIRKQGEKWRRGKISGGAHWVSTSANPAAPSGPSCCSSCRKASKRTAYKLSARA
jgi:hypothetical protein